MQRADDDFFLHEALALLLGDAVSARAVIAAALESAGRTEVPRDPRALVPFVRAHVVERIAELAGPRLALAFLEDLRARAGVSTDRPIHGLAQMQAPPSSSLPRKLALRPTSEPPRDRYGTRARRPEVVIVESDRFARSQLARVLVRGGADVSPYETVETQLAVNEVQVLVAGIHTARDLADLSLAIGTRRIGYLVLVVDAGVRDAECVARTSSVRYEIVPSSAPPSSAAALVLAHLRSAKAPSER